jgi:phospholipid N-methyltransferase
MVQEVGPQAGPVLELGAGTGVFTRALLERGIGPDDLTVVEFDDAFASLLASRFPEVGVIHADAARLSKYPELQGRRFGAALSGLPLLSMPLRKVVMILRGAFGSMHPQGSFYQFTYGPVCPVPTPVLERLGLAERVVGRTFRNVPPATVYAISRINRDDR